MLDKNNLLNLVTELARKFDSNHTRISISKNQIDVCDVKDALDNRIFSEEKVEKGWMVFINPEITANWAHRCEYYFIVSETEILLNKNAYWFPSEAVELEEIIFNTTDAKTHNI